MNKYQFVTLCSMMNCFCTAKIAESEGHRKYCTFEFKMATPGLMLKIRWKHNCKKINHFHPSQSTNFFWHRFGPNKQLSCSPDQIVFVDPNMAHNFFARTEPKQCRNSTRHEPNNIILCGNVSLICSFSMVAIC